MSNMSAETFSTCKLLDVRGLRVSFDAVDVLHGVDLTVHCGRIHALIGESGSGKSVLARSILGLAGRGARTTGSIRFLGRELVGLSEREYRAIRGADIGLVVQDAMSALNPMRTIGEQLVETIACRHPDFRSGASRASRSSRADRHDIALELLRTVGITAPEKRMNAYAHQLSGGMRQRVMIALALTGSPRLLLADEPTTALDVVVQRELLQEMRALVQARGMSMLIVTHDLNLARDVADDVSVMYAGHVLEEGPVSDVITRPAHPYTEGLLRAMPAMDGTRGRLIPIKGEIPPPDKLGSGCPFASRCPRVTNACRESLGAMTAVEDGRRRTRCDAALLTAAPHAPSCASRLASLPVQDTEFPVISDIRIARHCYVSRQGLLGRRRPWDVLQDIDLQVRSGEVMGLVGESGCGKSTLARLALGLIEPTEGTVRFKNAPIPERDSTAWRAQRASMQMIHQDPYACFDPRLPIIEQVAEPLRHHRGLSKEAAAKAALEVLRAAGLPAHHAGRRPSVMSGGQLQRAAIARAVALEPALLVCDEPVASLDVSIQAQVLELLLQLRNRMKMAMLFVSHNLSVVRCICDRVTVMYLGRIVESGTVEAVFSRPLHPYTKLLMASTPGVYLEKFVSLDMGTSYMTGQPVRDVFLDALGPTLSLMIPTAVVTLLIGIPSGVCAALHRNTLLDRSLMVMSVFGYAVPNFFMGVLLLLVFSIQLGWLPSYGNATVWHYIMPIITMATSEAAIFSRYARSAMIDALRLPCVRAARMRGLPERRIIWLHALPNAMLSILTILGFFLGTLVAGAVITENVFSWPGVGKLLVQSVASRDIPVVQMIVLVTGASLVTANLLMDLLALVVNPRLRKGDN